MDLLKYIHFSFQPNKLILYFIVKGFTLITTNGVCQGFWLDYLPYCKDSPEAFINGRSSCAALCANRASCIGFAFKSADFSGNSTHCYLYQSEDTTCPSDDWHFEQGTADYVITADELQELNGWQYDGYVCYGKNSGNITLQFELYI